MSPSRLSRGALPLLFVLLAAACGAPAADDAPEAAEDVVATGEPSEMARFCTPGNGGITLPPGFCAIVVHEGVGLARHIDVAPNGDIFVAIRNGRGDDGPGGIVVLRDSDGDGVADQEERWGENGGSEALLHGDHLYFGTDDAILRYSIAEGAMAPSGAPDTIVSGLPADRNHRSKSIAISEDGALYVNIGAPSNACMEEARTQGSPGKDPCDELETRAGIWRFEAGATGQTQADGTRFATGLRNTFALAVHPGTGQLYGVVHGRDQLHGLHEEHFTEQESSQNPAEEFVLISEGSDFGWPYCFHRYDVDRKVLGPEYGGDGEEVGRCAEMDVPLLSFPGHWAPNDLAFYTGSQFPDEYAGGAFIAFHGSWNRTPVQQGYQISFAALDDAGQPADGWSTFAEGFAGGVIESPRDAARRPTGVAEGPDGSLYVSDSVEGTIYRIVYMGSPPTS
jgi:glucose/arabinose dehydrogenase